MKNGIIGLLVFVLVAALASAIVVAVMATVKGDVLEIQLRTSQAAKSTLEAKAAKTGKKIKVLANQVKNLKAKVRDLQRQRLKDAAQIKALNKSLAERRTYSHRSTSRSYTTHSRSRSSSGGSEASVGNGEAGGAFGTGTSAGGSG